VGDLSVKDLLFRDKIMFKSHLIKSNHSHKQNVDTNGAPVFASDYNATV
jgi:hypothetical protein